MHIICEGLSVERCIIGGKKSAVGGANREILAVLDLSNVRKYWAGPPTTGQSRTTIKLREVRPPKKVPKRCNRQSVVSSTPAVAIS